MTKKKAKTITHSAATRRSTAWSRAPNGASTSVSTSPIATMPMPTHLSGRSRAVRGAAAMAPPVPPSTRWRNSWAPMRNDCIITGRLRIRVMMPAAATAPAPM